MFVLYADKNKLTVRQREPITSGSVNAYPVHFRFSPEWDGMKCTAVFQAGGETVSMLLDSSGDCSIPWEVLESPAVRLMAGVYGVIGEEVVLPTVWADLGTILTGVVPGRDAHPPTPSLWQQELELRANRLDYTLEGELGLYSGEKLLSSVPLRGGDIVSDHRALTQRDAANQHAIASIQGLAEALENIPAPSEPITNTELEEILS